MKYHAILIDDEEIMRDSFKALIPWEELGFTLDSALEDGKEAISYIENNSVDLIITDIKMPLFSGIDIAKYIHENSLDIKVVILSGYEDFNYARNAMEYGVKHYLLKTMSLPDMCSHISSVKKELDETRNEKQYMENLMLTVKKQFFLDLFFGAITVIDELYNRLYLAQIEEDIINYPCYILKITMKNYDDFFNNVWSFGKSGLENAFEHIFRDTFGFHCYILNHNSDVLKVFASGYNPAFSADTDLFPKIAEIIENNFRQVLNIEIKIETEQHFGSLYEILNAKKSHSLSENSLTEELTSIKQLLLSHASVGNISESKNLFSALVDSTSDFDFIQTKNTAVEIFLVLSDKLKKYNIDLSAIPDFSFSKILAFDNNDELKEWGHQFLGFICAQINNHFSDYNKNAITKARIYIKENCCNDITLNDVANSVYLSPDYLSRLLKKYTNENFVDILIKERMEKATVLLHNENLKIYEISQMVGYKTTKYFTKLFKLHSGITPTEYRNQLWRKS